jgi:hypothetical protein
MELRNGLLLIIINPILLMIFEINFKKDGLVHLVDAHQVTLVNIYL